MNIICALISNTTFLTVLSGTLVFIIGQIFIEFILKPIRNYKQLQADTAFCLRMYRDKFINCVEDENASLAAKEIGAKIIAYAQEKPWFVQITKEDLLECCGQFSVLYYACQGGLRESYKYEQTKNAEKIIVKTMNLFWSAWQDEV